MDFDSNFNSALFDHDHPVRLLKGQLYQGTFAAGGYDLFATEDTLVPIKGRAMIPTGVFTSMNPDMVAILRDRSGLAAKFGITVLAGVIDADYDKEWKVVLLNSGNEPFKVNKGDRIAQAVFIKRYDVHCATKEAIVIRGENRVGGFGSTGV